MTIRLIQGASFDPETTRLLGLAYERACESVAPDMTIREALAKRIIEAAKRGERPSQTSGNSVAKLRFSAAC
jgi:hypothetical protein